MKFDDPEVVESICYQMRMADYPRGKNRALINNLFNGFPPFTEDEEEENNIAVNVNFLEGTQLAHDARSQFYQSIMKPGNYFTSKTDSGPVHKRSEYGVVVTQERTKVMKKSMVYTESNRSEIAMNILHGISPSGWRDEYKWCPYAMGIEDVYVPGGTLLTMENLPFFAIYRTLTAPEMVKLVNCGAEIDPAWNRPMLNGAIKWVDKESQTLMYNNWPEVWAPEKTMERIKGDGGFYYGDQVPTINVFDFYFWNDSNKVSGWNRRMVLDAWSMPEASTVSEGKVVPVRKQGKFFDKYRRKFLYDPGERKVAPCHSQIINWQFADLSAVAPFKYHSVRSLGFLLYSICHLQNRMRCKFSEAVFEQLMMYFRIKGQDDMQRALVVDLVNRGFIDDSVQFIPAAERYQVNTQLAQMGLMNNDQIIRRNSSSYVQNQDYSKDRVEKTKFQVMAEVNAMTSLVSAALTQAYMYKANEYREIARRFFIKDSPDPQVRTFQANCLRRGVSEKVLYNAECWEHEPERTMGAGNKTLEMAIVEQLMQFRNLFDPEPQREILRDFVLGITDNPDKANTLVPTNPIKITDSVHDAQLAAGTLMAGLPVAVKTGINHIEYVETLIATLATLVDQARKVGIPSSEKLAGMMNMLTHIGQHVGIIAQDKNEQQRVKNYGNQLGQIANLLKAFQQQIAEAQQAAAEQNGQQPDPELQAKIQAMVMQAQVKAENTKTAHAQRTAQRQIQFEREEMRKDAELQNRLKRENITTANDLRAEDAYTASEIALEHKKANEAPKKVDKGSSGD